jgi:hypothetical protein
VATDPVISHLWLLPLSWVVHDLEEVLMRDRWMHGREETLRTLADRSRLAGRVIAIHSTPTREFVVAVLAVGSLLFAVTAVATQRPTGVWGLLFAVFLGGYFIYAFLHVGQSALLRGYTPGVVTAVAVVVPVSAYLYRLLFQTGILDGRLALTTALLGIVVFFPVVLGAHRLARLRR